MTAGDSKVVFEYFIIADSVTYTDLEKISEDKDGETNPTVIEITAYAIQEDGFATTAIDAMLVALNLKAAE